VSVGCRLPDTLQAHAVLGEKMPAEPCCKGTHSEPRRIHDLGVALVVIADWYPEL